jgi:penicillin-binding protein 2
MLVLDRLKQDGRRLHFIAMCMAAGLILLLAGLWFVQIVDAQRFANNLKRQSYRTVRMPAIRGKIFDRSGRVLAADRPRYNAILYLEGLQGQFDARYAGVLADYAAGHPEAARKNGRIVLPSGERRRLQLQADCDVVSNITSAISASLNEPRVLNSAAFIRHYNEYPYVPFQLVPDLAPRQVAIFAEQLSGQPDVDLETQPVRVYPNGTVAAHLLGFVQHVDSVSKTEASFTMPDFEGKSGIERVYNAELGGQPGYKSVLVNNQNYRQREQIDTANQPGDDVYLTIDLSLQQAAEKALAGAQPNVRGAVVVLDPRNGDILVMASAPSFDPNSFVPGLTSEEWARLNDPKYKPQLNRAVTGAYFPGSTFKIITGIACLESGLDPKEVYDSPGEYKATPSSRPIGDTAGAGPFDFDRAFYRSSNTYFIHYGLQAGLRKILEVAKRFHLGEKTGLETKQEVSGEVPSPDDVGHSFSTTSAADVCIGQEITATPLQLALMVGVIANGGTLYWPRVASRACSPETGEVQELVQQGRVRDHVAIDPRHLEIIRHAMLADTEHPTDSASNGGTAYGKFHHPDGSPCLANFRVAGKTGTAEVKSPGSPYKKVTWFDSYGPFEDPRYVVVVMVEDGTYGGPTCAPVAEKIYEAIVKEEHSPPPKSSTVALN